MPTTAPALAFEHTYSRALPELNTPWRAAAAPAPKLLVVNEALAAELGLGAVPVGLLTGADAPAEAVAMGYSGHQFGGFSPRLGDGRALLVGELVDAAGNRRDLHLKGSGRTPWSRGGDGKAAVGPMLREHLVSEAMHALGIPTTRSLGVVATGEDVVRETMLPGAVLARVGASHLRVGTFEYAAQQGPDVVRRLADYAIARHHPEAADAPEPYLAFLAAVLEAQASLVARWMHVGFVHGVMNTDNTTISGETIDYGPCAFMEAFDPATVFSSIDHAGRYAYGSQPPIVHWNLARLAESLLPLIDGDPVEAATAVLRSFPERFDGHWARGMQAKLGLSEPDDALVADLLELLQAQEADWTSAFRALAQSLRGDRAPLDALLTGTAAWEERWHAALGGEPAAVAAAMDRVNPLYIPRNALVEEALTAATLGDLAPFERLLAVVTEPFAERPGLEAFAVPAGTPFAEHRTFCGT